MAESPNVRRFGCGCPEHSLGGKPKAEPTAPRYTYGTGRRSLMPKPTGTVHRIEHTSEDHWGFDIPTLELSPKKLAGLAAAKTGGTS